MFEILELWKEDFKKSTDVKVSLALGALSVFILLGILLILMALLFIFFKKIDKKNYFLLSLMS